MNIELERINNDYLFEVANSNGHRVLLDNNSKKTGSVKGISPMELLLMGLAGCSSIDIVAILNKQKIIYILFLKPKNISLKCKQI